MAASVVLGFCFLSVMVLVARFLWVHRSTQNDSDSTADNAVSTAQQELSREGSWLRIIAPKQQRKHWTPTLSGFIKAGDEGVYSSTLFNTLHGPPSEIPLDLLYSSFANELRARPVAERSTYPSELSKFLSTADRPRRVRSLRATRDGRPELRASAPRKSIDLAEMGIGRSRSRKTSPTLVSTFNALPSESGSQSPIHALWTQDVRHAQLFEGRLGTQLSGSELAALSIILGSPVDLIDHGEKGRTELRSSIGGGAHGIVISAKRLEGGGYHITLSRQERSISQLPAQGSGYSTLYAKHLAAGSLPFSLDNKTVNAILITNDTLEALTSGAPLHLQRTSTRSRASRFLASLPNSREPTFHTLTPSSASTSTPRLLLALSALPFTGGLPPLASTSLVQTVAFVASGGLVPGHLLQRLDALVEKVHRHAPTLRLFGPLLDDSNAGVRYRMRERLRKRAGSPLAEPLADRAARTHRYVTLLERLVCLVPDMKPGEALAAVREAAAREFAAAYENAVAAQIDSAAETKSATDVDVESMPSSASLARRSMSLTSPRPSSSFPPRNLGTLVEEVLKGSLPFDVRTVGLVARLVVVAWTMGVERVAWGEAEEGVKVGVDGAVSGDMVLW